MGECVITELTLAQHLAEGQGHASASRREDAFVSVAFARGDTVCP